MCQATSLRLPCVPESARRARRLVVDQLASIRGAGDDQRDAAVLVTSELVTNALAACVSAIEIEVVRHHGRLDIAMHDDTSHGSQLRPARTPLLATSGRGLVLVDALSEVWGVRPEGTDQGSEGQSYGSVRPDPAAADRPSAGRGKTVWARLLVDGADADDCPCEDCSCLT